MPLRLALVEDDPRVRELLHTYLSRQPEFAFVLVAESVEEFLSGLDDLVALPQVLLLDIGLPGMSGVEGLPLIKARLPELEVVIQTVFEDTDRIYQALCNGANGYVLKNTPLPEVKAALLDVARGGAPLSRAVARKVLGHFKPTPKAQASLLSEREHQVLDALVDGLSEKLVASRLDLTVSTVHSYVKNIYKKLHVSSRSELMNRAVKGEL